MPDGDDEEDSASSDQEATAGAQQVASKLPAAEGSNSSLASDDDNDSDGDSSSGMQEEEEEPRLKFERIQLQPDILAKDNASAIAVARHGSLFAKSKAIGTHAGSVIVFDNKGKSVRQYNRIHAASVLALNFDSAGEFLGSASMDGKITILPIANDDQTPPAIYDMQRPMRAIALDPEFAAKRNNRQFVSGGMAGALILHERSWLGNKDTTLHSGQGPIWSISWNPSTSLIAWCNDECVRVHDLKAGARGGIGTFTRPDDSPRVDLYKCTFVWVPKSQQALQKHTLLIASADCITVALVYEQERQRTVSMPGVGPSAQWALRTTAIFQIDAMLSGIALYTGKLFNHPSNKESYLVLVYPEEDDSNRSVLEATEDRESQRRKIGNRPELRLISDSGEELSSDALTIEDFARYQCNDYSLAGVLVQDGPVFYAISPKHVIVARPRDALDHVDWLIEHEKFEEALKSAEDLPADQKVGTDVAEIGMQHLQQLFKRGEYNKAAACSGVIIGRDSKKWDDWIFQFIEVRQLSAIIPHIPIKDPQLDHVIYEVILAHFLAHDPKMLHSTLNDWPTEIYDKNAVIVAVESALEKHEGDETLENCLADLYIINNQPVKALPYFIKLKRPSTFNLIQDNGLFSAIADRALELFQLEAGLSMLTSVRVNGSASPLSNQLPVVPSLLANHTQFIPVASVVTQLRSHRQFLYRYLNTLFSVDTNLVAPHANDLVDLYAEFDSGKLLNFLRLGLANPEEAYEVCRKRDLVPEMVFLLGRMGDNKKALRLVIERMGDVHRAIEFAKEQRDPELWEDLLSYSETRPAFIRALLEESGTQGDPTKLIKRIRNGLEIPGLQSALVKILQDFTLQVSLMEGCETILASDCSSLSLQLNRSQTRAFLGGGERNCQGCGQTLFQTNAISDKAVALVFLCHHAFHASCAFPSAESLLPSRPGIVLAVADLLSTKAPSQSLVERQISAKLSYRADLRSHMTALECPVCAHKQTRVS